ncbi:MAG: type II toxin-antitoxin system RelE/ParE family toxin [Alphaproteobacteria bacterium]|nr:type II toxin-antitoxin system RelE/ParE family toxin [Alphaproteobacteria bacterium]
MNKDERAALVDHLARHPDGGDLIKGAGGVRKLRWALAGRGKSGGARVIYFFHNADMPLYVLSVYAKNRQADISDADRNDFKGMAKLLVEAYQGSRYE